MLPHIFSLLGRAFATIPVALGSTWLGLLSPILIALIGEGIGAWIFGAQAMKANWKKATGIGLAAIGAFYSIVFLACVFTAIYKDHAYFLDVTHRLGDKVQAGEFHEYKAVNDVQKDLGTKLTASKEECATLQGANSELTKRTGDQQNTINNC
jgi:hypothetical protein